MSHVQLTAKHRPQTFAQVAGQEEIRAILSRAAAQDRVAAAYLFSGTRGVGKTTLARIFAKALNCETAPTEEPCNKCHHCRQITIGSAPDVAEIDGASNRGIEQARRLKEDVGYAPLECRYKVIIIDEAHMLTKEAFNALLKTMEEPPPRVTFIMATTEPHKFPATIISRSQHYVFKMLSQAGLQNHLERILELEGREYEPAATALLARRAAGSVRDGMSLLEQVLTISDQALRLEDVRRTLGLAGGELFQRLIQAMREQDCLAVHDVLGDLLRQGLDLGFFLRELAGLWRNLFLLRQVGDKALPLLELPEEEGGAWLGVAADLSPTYIHAAWQITLEAQRKVLTSLEPAQALEMLLLNLTYLPSLVPLDGAFSNEPPQAGPADRGTPPRQSWRERSQQPPRSHSETIQGPSEVDQPARAPKPASPPPSPPSPPVGPSSKPPAKAETIKGPTAGTRPSAVEGSEQQLGLDGGYPPPAPASVAAQNVHEPGPQLDPAMETMNGTLSPSSPKTADLASSASLGSPVRTLEGFLAHYDRLCRTDQARYPKLRQIEYAMTEQALTLHCRHSIQYDMLSDPNKLRILEDVAQEYFGRPIQVELVPPQNGGQSQGSSSTPAPAPDKHPLVAEFVEQFKAKVFSVEPRQTH
ncbi:DNA polymerase III subunit gamma/tau [Desulfonatronum thiodismutans]|uniref:DNA polymerase III subunit gamma/tau n=1 Tax=Desulfonatronum thiodismutans TaxID=159290 RepID=UPI0004ABD469|nr:DNA polymerase III subunit gamma/tau [Desulfonatronum thiodismutans]